MTFLTPLVSHNASIFKRGRGGDGGRPFSVTCDKNKTVICDGQFKKMEIYKLEKIMR